jgi:hypothetical protein
MNQHIYKRLAFAFLVLTLASGIIQQYLDNINVVTAIAPSTLCMLFIIWLIPVLYPALSHKKFTRIAASCALGSLVYALTTYWSNNAFILASLLSILLAFSVSSFVYYKLERDREMANSAVKKASV